MREPAFPLLLQAHRHVATSAISVTVVRKTLRQKLSTRRGDLRREFVGRLRERAHHPAFRSVQNLAPQSLVGLEEVPGVVSQVANKITIRSTSVQKENSLGKQLVCSHCSLPLQRFDDDSLAGVVEPFSKIVF